MKHMIKYLILLVSLIVVGTTHLKVAQLNYRDQYEQCLDDYQKMYKMMDNKLKFYSDNEKSLLDSVKGTVLKAYEKSEKSIEMYKKKISELEQKNSDLQSQLKSKSIENENQKISFETKYKGLNQKLSSQASQIDHLSTNQKVADENSKRDSQKIKKLKNEVQQCKNIRNKKETDYKIKIEELSKSVENIGKCKEDNANKKNDSDSEKKEEASNEKIAEAHIQSNKNLKNEIVRGEKIKANLNLIVDKLDKLSGINTTSTTEEIVNTEETPDDEVNEEDGQRKSNEKSKVKYGKKSEKKSEKKPDNKKQETKKSKREEHKSEDQDEVGRFLEVGSEVTKVKSKTDLEHLSYEQSQLQYQLDYLLFEDIDKSRQIYEKLNKVDNQITNLTHTKDVCENKLQISISENLELKEALAELEIKYRLSKIQK